MFTGIIEGLGHVISLNPRDDGAVLTIDSAQAAVGARLGDSIAVDGVCLTVTAVSGVRLTFDIMGETLRRTTIGLLRPGAKVNVERALAAGDRLGGHIVQGHVDATGRVLSLQDQGVWELLRVSLPPELAPLVAEKGSIAVDGVSLTVTSVSAPEDAESWFEVGLIPETLQRTVLGGAEPGAPVNLEVDVIARQLARLAAFPTLRPPMPTPTCELAAATGGLQ